MQKEAKSDEFLKIDIIFLKFDPPNRRCASATGRPQITLRSEGGGGGLMEREH